MVSLLSALGIRSLGFKALGLSGNILDLGPT
jgi:hypothetical protein